MNTRVTRRQLLLAAACASLGWQRAAAASSHWFRYLLASAMYGQEPLATVLAEAQTLGINAIDLWPKVHGAQREEVDSRGADAVRAEAAAAGCSIACLTRYDLGATGLTDELDVAAELGATTIVSGPKGKSPIGANPSAAELKAAVKQFVDQMQPLTEKAAERGVTIAIENHRRNLFEPADSLRYLAEFTAEQPNLAIALAPAHLPQQPADVATLVRDLGSKLAVFYAWERGNEFLRKQPTGRELEQLPGRGTFDFGPVVDALAGIDFHGWTSVFMHPIPRGIPAAGSVRETTDEIAAAMQHLRQL